MKLKKIIIVLFLLKIGLSFSQSSFDSFLKPADSLNKQRRNEAVISETAIAGATLIALNQLWYVDYPKSNFHTINDNAEWNQMDKAGHFYSSYQLGSLGANALKWSGASRKSQLIYGSTIGFAFLSATEIMDGYSSKWGFSVVDMAANATGTVFYVSQELLWKEQRIVPKFSFHTTIYPSARPDVLGSTLTEQVLKDYNGQTYWLSANMHSFFKHANIPNWLNVAFGYGSQGMITGKDELVNTIFFDSPRTRQYYLSFDADLTKIKTKSHLLKTVFYLFNTVKIPAPTLEMSRFNGIKLHFVYF